MTNPLSKERLKDALKQFNDYMGFADPWLNRGKEIETIRAALSYLIEPYLSPEMKHVADYCGDEDDSGVLQNGDPNYAFIRMLETLVGE